MNRERVSAELDPATVAWLQAHASADTWEQLARDLAVELAVRALGPREFRGEAGYNRVFYDLRCTDDSPTIRHVAATLGYDPAGRAWSIRRVANTVAEFLELHAGGYAVHRRVQERCAPGTHEDSLAA